MTEARTDLRHRVVETPVGPITIVATSHGVTRILFPTEPLDAALPGDDLPVAGERDPIVDAAESQLIEYFEGTRRRFDLPLDLVGTEFQRQAWLALADVPYGETTTYGAQAERIGRPGAFRAVGAANGRNPVPIVLPCHRIIGADGSLTGFGGGLELKQRLIEHEQAQQALPGVRASGRGRVSHEPAPG